jgi:hypothetical protein
MRAVGVAVAGVLVGVSARRISRPQILHAGRPNGRRGTRHGHAVAFSVNTTAFSGTYRRWFDREEGRRLVWRPGSLPQLVEPSLRLLAEPVQVGGVRE